MNYKITATRVENGTSDAEYSIAEIVAVDLGSRVEAGEGEDYDAGTVDAINGADATVRWDSGVVTTIPVKLLSVI